MKKKGGITTNMFGLQARLEQLAQEQALVTAEHQARRLSGQRLHEAELHVQAKAAELNYKEAHSHRLRMLLQHEYAALMNERETLIADLALCQDTIHE